MKFLNIFQVHSPIAQHWFFDLKNNNVSSEQDVYQCHLSNIIEQQQWKQNKLTSTDETFVDVEPKPHN